MEVMQLLSHGDPGNPRYSEEPGAMGAGDMAPVGFFPLISSGSAPVRTGCEGGVATWMAETWQYQVCREACSHG